MKLYRPKSIVSRYYTVLFNLPKWQVLTAALTSLSSLLVVAMGIGSVPLILNAAVTYMVLEAYARLNRETVFYKVKRRLGLSLATLVYTAIFTFITRSSLVALIASTSLLTVVIVGLDGTAPPRYLLSIAPPLLSLTVLTALGMIPASHLYFGVVAIMALVFVDMAIYAFMSRRRIDGWSFPDLGTLFLKNWLDRNTLIERAFDEMGEYQYVNPRIIELGDLVIVYSDVHYGPFSNIGSSRLPIMIKDFVVKTMGKYAISLHGLGSHDRNIVSSEYTLKFIDELTKTLTVNDSVQLKYHGAFKKTRDSWEALAVVFDKATLVLISRPGLGIEDLPYFLQLEYELKARSAGLGDLILVDAHNWELQGELELDELKALLDEVVEEVARFRSREPIEVEYKYRCFKTKATGLVDGEACIICLGGSSRESVCLLYLRGNNLKPGARDSLLERLKYTQATYCEVLTNDEHTETGTRAYIAYYPVHDSPELLDDVERFAKELSRVRWRVGATLRQARMELKLMGRSIEVIKRGLSSSLKETAVLLTTYVFGSPIVLMAISTLIGL
ncbi:MAG: DUF2070 family protein [Desulfurococcaceae archaeon]|nr:DUF2070 family protein [Desulfurococcaceae archaeon]